MADERNYRACRRFHEVVRGAVSLGRQPGLTFLESLEVLARETR